MIESFGVQHFPDELATAIYGAATPETSLCEPLGLLRTALASSFACLRISQRGPQSRERLYVSGLEGRPEFLSEWEARSGRELASFALQLGEPRVLNGADLAVSGGVVEMLRRHDVGHLAMMLIGIDEGAEYTLHVARAVSEVGYTPEEVNSFKMIGAHFGRAMKLRRQMLKAEIMSGVQSDVLDRLGIAAILLGGNGQFTLLNETSRHMVADGRGLRLSGGRLRAADERDDRHFQGIVKEVLASDWNDRARAMLLKHEGAGRDLNLLVTGRRYVSLFTDRSETCALVFLRCSGVGSDADIDVLQQLFSFTRAEAKLALGLAKGKRLEDLEGELNIRHNTARAHLRSMFVKADVNRQAELVHLLANSLAPLGRPRDVTAMAA